MSWQKVGGAGFDVGTMLLLTDGSVMCQDAGMGTRHWHKLTPDENGSYTKGLWTQLADGLNSPLYYASGILRNGHVFMAGGEYNGGTHVDLDAAQIYDPVVDSWATITTPGWGHIGDAPCCVLPDGRVLLGDITDTKCSIYDPVANIWAAAANKNDFSSEESWVLLRDNTVLVVQCRNHPHTEKYLIMSNLWTTAGSTPSDLVESASIETGPAILLTDGRAFAVGATGHTALYTPPALARDPGVWDAGPDFPTDSNGQQLGAKDAPACLLPSGRVLCAVGPVTGKSADYLGPTSFFEFDPFTNTLNRANDPPTNNTPPYSSRMLLLPTGQVLFSNESGDIEAYTPNGEALDAWRPQIIACPKILVSGRSFTLNGTQLNGLSQAVAYGDDASMATNYPLVRLSNTSRTFFCRTRDFSTMAVATGNQGQSTTFAVPGNTPAGFYDLFVIANGISSEPFAASVVKPC